MSVRLTLGSALAALCLLAVGSMPAAAETSSPVPNLSLRGGVMVSPRGAGVAGVDIGIPTLNLVSGWEGRIDLDVIIKANLGGVNTIVPVTADLLHYLPSAAGKAFYLGGGVGAKLGGSAGAVLKGIVGTELGGRFGVEGNIMWTKDDTLLTFVGRIRL